MKINQIVEDKYTGLPDDDKFGGTSEIGMSINTPVGTLICMFWKNWQTGEANHIASRLVQYNQASFEDTLKTNPQVCQQFIEWICNKEWLNNIPKDLQDIALRSSVGGYFNHIKDDADFLNYDPKYPAVANMVYQFTINMCRFITEYERR